MKLIVHGKNVTVTPALQEYVERKLGRLESWFEEACDMHVTLSVQGHKQLHVAEVMMTCKGIVLRAEEKRDDMYASIDVVADKLERQTHKFKDKIKQRLRHQTGIKAHLFENVEPLNRENESPFELARMKTVPNKPEDIEEAILQMNMLDHNFHLFFNRDSNKTELVYRRNDGTYGLITTA
ncbi:ribosome hibernation-promoting factor, HPF/YfiA family [Paenibacillus sp. N3.4]|uniref:ribosome hibernation-promoting factor, HPF/YfiA family n=1 Tax=Paenibacillus sp. N3.4 TaxID=2603222 RepID=UPI0011C982BD|nr:ribosome-associated translation inhibitor RaiA [Paenibacillus sp. N3.4]TXK84541.1 ribosome-associated translation inhibitor RaiA [Paenibacillus sp. N3.4]